MLKKLLNRQNKKEDKSKGKQKRKWTKESTT